MIGTIFWRLTNYGLLATVKYLINFKSQFAATSNSSLLDVSSSELESQDCNSMHFVEAQNFVRKVMEELKNSIEFRINRHLMKNVLDEESSIARLIALTIYLKKLDADIFLETGTQHGISAYMAARVCEEYKLRTKCISIDVKNKNFLFVHQNVNYVQLMRPSRSKFKKFTQELDYESIIFFHDSDHSFENMTFEFNWAWNNLNCVALISDDIDGNNAFSVFCQKNQLVGMRLCLDHGPALGICERKND